MAQDLGDYGEKLLANKIQEQQNRKELYDILPERTRKVIEGFNVLKDTARAIDDNRSRLIKAREKYFQERHKIVLANYLTPKERAEVDSAERGCCPKPINQIYAEPPMSKSEAEVVCGMGLSTDEERKQAHAEGVPYMLQRITRKQLQQNRDDLFAIKPDRELVDAMLEKGQKDG